MFHGWRNIALNMTASRYYFPYHRSLTYYECSTFPWSLTKSSYLFYILWVFYSFFSSSTTQSHRIGLYMTQVQNGRERKKRSRKKTIVNCLIVCCDREKYTKRKTFADRLENHNRLPCCLTLLKTLRITRIPRWVLWASFVVRVMLGSLITQFASIATEYLTNSPFGKRRKAIAPDYKMIATFRHKKKTRAPMRDKKMNTNFFLSFYFLGEMYHSSPPSLCLSTCFMLGLDLPSLNTQRRACSCVDVEKSERK